MGHPIGWRLVAASFGIAIAAVACSNGSGSITIDGKTANDHGSKEIGGESTVELEADNDGSDYYFSPTVLTASAGQTVTIELKNEGDTDHNFTIDSLGINEDVAPDATVNVQLTLPQSGTVVFYCEYHEGSGMLGKLTVT